VPWVLKLYLETETTSLFKIDKYKIINMPKYSITIFQHQTSFSLEIEFYQILKQISIKKNISIPKLIEEIELSNSKKYPLSSAIRVYILNYFSNQLSFQ
jgi:predicted DNA-binding ribbon-helix-helix protein